ncbi:MAG: hypothetical protein K0R24_1728 [Gammaproteobacteria bacterium]|jgi:DNA-binding CsgD family transcriptional regulator|nr:hypothetical protein [Gammaproteobacteria bacterium]
MNKDVDQINYLAIDLLERLGNSKPTESQIEIMESILLQVVPPRRVFDKTLTLVKIISILLAMKGKTSREIADLLDISQMDVEGDYEEIKNKLNLSAVA